jgi:quercetin dioxygenase-like cupin family protein
VLRLVALAAAAVLAALVAGTALGALGSGTLPTAGYIYTSTLDEPVDGASGHVTAADLATLERYVASLSSIADPTSAQRVALATYADRLSGYRSRYASEVALHAPRGAVVKTTYSLVPPSDSYRAGWHFHNGPVIVTVTAGTLTLVDASCTAIDVAAGHSYIESPGQVLDARAVPAKNAGVADVEWFTTRLYPAGAIDPVPVAPHC